MRLRTFCLEDLLPWRTFSPCSLPDLLTGINIAPREVVDRLEIGMNFATLEQRLSNAPQQEDVDAEFGYNPFNGDLSRNGGVGDGILRFAFKEVSLLIHISSCSQYIFRLQSHKDRAQMRRKPAIVVHALF